MKSFSYILVILTLFFSFGCEKSLFEPVPGTDPESLFEELWTTFQSDYAGFEERNVNWQAAYDQYRPQVDANTSDDELAGIFKQMLRLLDDGHVSLSLPGESVFYSNEIVDLRIDNELFDLDLIRKKYLQNNFKENGNGGNVYGWIGNIGYLHIKWIGGNMLDISEVLDEFEDADGLIVDLRHNQGGDFTYGYSEFGRFTNQERLAHRSKTKNGPGSNDYSDWYDWNIYPAGDYFDKPIILITDRYTISAGERMTMAFKALPNVVHIGDTTNGAFATKINKELPNGWYYSVVTQKTEFVDGKNYEGTGMPPEVYVKNTAAEMAAETDKALEEALQQL